MKMPHEFTDAEYVQAMADNFRNSPFVDFQAHARRLDRIAKMVAIQEAVIPQMQKPIAGFSRCYVGQLFKGMLPKPAPKIEHRLDVKVTAPATANASPTYADAINKVMDEFRQKRVEK